MKQQNIDYPYPHSMIAFYGHFSFNCISLIKLLLLKHAVMFISVIGRGISEEKFARPGYSGYYS